MSPNIMKERISHNSIIVINHMEKKRPISFSFFFFFLASCFSPMASQNATPTLQNHNITALFAFGDSTVDSGNNDRLVTTPFRADHLPYGRDFNGGIATGRFTDGKLVTDMIVTSLGIKDFVPAYFDLKITNHDLLTGVSFASAASGLDDMTANIAGVIHMSTQLVEFQGCLSRIQATVGNTAAAEIVQNAMFSIGAGTNDMLFNYYYLPTRRLEFSLSGYHDFLLTNLETFVTGLYRMGARKFSITGLPPIGCLPVQVTLSIFTPSTNILERKCVDQQNVDSQAYNIKLQSYITRWQAKLPGSKFAYADIYNPLMDMILNPKKYGFEQTLKGCCGTGYIEVADLCNIEIPVCSDPSKYIFFDCIHPTEATYQILANVILQNAIPLLVN